MYVRVKNMQNYEKKYELQKKTSVYDLSFLYLTKRDEFRPYQNPFRYHLNPFRHHLNLFRRHPIKKFTRAFHDAMLQPLLLSLFQ